MIFECIKEKEKYIFCFRSLAILPNRSNKKVNLFVNIIYYSCDLQIINIILCFTLLTFFIVIKTCQEKEENKINFDKERTDARIITTPLVYK